MQKTKTTKIICLLLAVLLLTGCEKPESMVVDQCLQREIFKERMREIFKECMAVLPKGSTSVHNSNDWDEVVAECASVAYYQALIQLVFEKPECRVHS